MRDESEETSTPHDGSPPSPEMGPRIVGGTFGFVFLGIGLTVIVFLWSQPFGEFGAPPLVFRVFGSFIAVAFVAMGGFTAWAAVTGAKMGPNVGRSSHSGGRGPADRRAVGRFQCQRCGAPLDRNADVSPHGDVKCSHCDCWFNIHESDEGAPA